MPRLTDPSATERPVPRFIGGNASVQPVSGLSAEGGALMQFGEEMQRAVLIEQEKVDTTKVEDAWNQYKNAALDATSGEKGVLRRQGADAVNGNLLKELTTSLQDHRKKIAEGLGTDEQRQRFITRADATDLQVKHQILSHIAEQTTAYATTVFNGSKAAANAQVAAMPTDPGVFAGARDTLFAQTDALLKGKGVTDQAEIKRAKDALNDELWQTRIHTLLYSQPMLAEAVLRANEKEIKDPKVRLLLQAQTREAALGVSANLEAKKVVEEVRQKTPTSATSTGTVEAVKLALRAAEGSGPEAESIQGARGRMQITKDTFDAYKRSGESFDVEADRVAVANRKIEADFAFYGGDVKKVAAAYIGGRGAVDAQGNIRDVKDKLGTTAKGYAEKVASLVESGIKKIGADPLAQNTNGLPSSRDIAAQLPRMLARVEERANTLYGTDQGNPDRAAFIRRMTTEIQSAVASDVQQLNAIQRQAQGLLIDAVAGIGGASAGVMPAGGTAPAKGITSFAQIQADQKLFQAWQMMDPQAKLGIERLMEHNLRADDKGDDTLYRELWNRIHLEPGDPRKIDFYAQIVKPELADRLSIKQIGQLRLEIDRSETPGGRSIAQMRRSAEAQVGTFFKTHIMFTAQPDRQIAATMRWAEDVGKKVDEYVKQNQQEKVRAMFMLDTPESVVSPKYLQSYINTTPAQGLADAAGAVRAGQAPAVPPAAQPKEIDTREKLDAWFQTLPPTVTTFVGADGKVRMVPGRQAAQAATPTTMLETGKLSPPAAPQAKPDTIPQFVSTNPVAAGEAARKARGKAIGEVADVVQGTVAGIPGVAIGATATAIEAAAGAVKSVTSPDRSRILNQGFRALIERGTYSEPDLPLIRAALADGDLTPTEKMKAGQMLKAAKGAR